MLPLLPLRTGRRARRSFNALAAALIVSALLVGLQSGWAGASPATDQAQAQAQAQKHLLVLSDMPRGWRKEKGSSGGGSNNFPGATQLASCIGVPANLITSNPPEADSPYYENKSGSLEVQDSVSVFSSAKAAKSEFGAIANPKTSGCMSALMNGPLKAKITSSAGTGATVGNISVTRADSADFGKGTSVLVMSIPISSQGVSFNTQLLMIYYVKGEFGQQLEFNSYGSPFPTPLARSLTAIATKRL